MPSDQNSEAHVLNRLLTELGLSPLAGLPSSEEAASLYRLTPNLAATELDVRQTRILERSMQWIGFLHDQAEQLTSIAARLYEKLAASNPRPWIEFIAATGTPREAVVDRLEWTLAALEYWIEEQQPPDGSARFQVRWTADDGLASWVTMHEEPRKPTSLRAVVEDGATTEGEFPSPLSREIAVLVVGGLRAGEFNLLRLRRVVAESRPEESMFQLLPRGEAYKAALAASEEQTSVLPAETEAQLAYGETIPLAAYLDNANYAAVNEYVSGASREHSLQIDVIEAVKQIADRCHLRTVDVVRCLLSLANHQLDMAARAGDHIGIVQLGRTIKTLTGFVLQEPQT